MRFTPEPVMNLLKDRHWMFNNTGEAVAILDDDCIRDTNGYVTAWFEETGFREGRIYSVTGVHIGWIDAGGFISDIANRTLGHLQGSIIFNLYKRWFKRPNEEPIFAPRPDKPIFEMPVGKLPNGGESDISLEMYLYG